jgi:hypothetical protein
MVAFLHGKMKGCMFLANILFCHLVAKVPGKSAKFWQNIIFARIFAM